MPEQKKSTATENAFVTPPVQTETTEDSGRSGLRQQAGTLPFAEGSALLSPGAPVVQKKDAAPATDQKPADTTQDATTTTPLVAAGDKKPAYDYEAELRKVYELQFGKKVGGALYDGFKSALSGDALKGYMKQGLEGPLKDLVEQLKKGATPESVAAQYQQALQKSSGDLAKELAAVLVDNPLVGGLADVISTWVREHPLAVVIIAATSAVLTKILAHVCDFDFDIPEIKQSFAINKELSMGFNLDIGTLREWTFNAIGLSLDYHTKSFSFAFDTEVTQDKKEGENGEQDVTRFAFNATSTQTLLDKVEKENDAVTGALKKDYRQKIEQQLGVGMKMDDWSLSELNAMWRLTFSSSQTDVDTQVLDEFKQTAAFTRAQTFFMQIKSDNNFVERTSKNQVLFNLVNVITRDVATELRDGDKTTGEDKTVYQQKLAQEFGINVNLAEWTPAELSLFYKASLSLSQKQYSSSTIDDLKYSTAWEKSLTLWSSVLFTAPIQSSTQLTGPAVDFKLGISYLLNRQTKVEQTTTDGRRFTQVVDPFSFRFDASVGVNNNNMFRKPEATFNIGFTISW